MIYSEAFTKSRGFTLVEAIMVIAITGIVAGIVAIFIKSPVDSYFDSARRAALTDVADTAVRRMARDVHLALPNSVRNPVDGSDQCIEFIPSKIGGRYRAAASGTTTAEKDAVLEFTEYKWDGTTKYDDGFDMLWLNSALPAANQIDVGDVVVVYNDGGGKSDCTGSIVTGEAGGNAYCGYNAIKVGGILSASTTNTTKITFDTAAVAPFNRKQLPSESPASRFQVIPSNEHVVAYGCSAGVLYRYSRTLAGAWTQPAGCSAMVAGAHAAIFANNITTCSFHYEPPGSSTGLSRFGIVSISLEIAQDGEAVKLYHQVHVDNTP